MRSVPEKYTFSCSSSANRVLIVAAVHDRRLSGVLELRRSQTAATVVRRERPCFLRNAAAFFLTAFLLLSSWRRTKARTGSGSAYVLKKQVQRLHHFSQRYIAALRGLILGRLNPQQRAHDPVRQPRLGPRDLPRPADGIGGRGNDRPGDRPSSRSRIRPTLSSKSTAARFPMMMMAPHLRKVFSSSSISTNRLELGIKRRRLLLADRAQPLQAPRH